jgi:hypothetical protein
MSAVRIRDFGRWNALRRGARSTLVVGAALAAMALGCAARADARMINLGACFGSCAAPAIDDPPAANNHPAAKITLSRPDAGRTDGPKAPSSALVFDRPATPTVLASGLPSPLSSADAQTPRWVSPYDYFEDVIDIPLPAGAWAQFAAASFFFFAPSFLDRLTFTDGLSADPLSGKYSPPPPM